MASGGGKSGPYSLPKGEAYPNEAYPFGIGPGSKAEGWEAITYICYIGCTLWLVGGLAFKENDSFKVGLDKNYLFLLCSNVLSQHLTLFCRLISF